MERDARRGDFGQTRGSLSKCKPLLGNNRRHLDLDRPVTTPGVTDCKLQVDISTWRIEPATAESLEEVATWRYESPYDFYNDDGKPVRNPERFFAVRDDDGRLVGSLYFEERADGVFYVLGMRPDLTGWSRSRRRVRPARARLRSRTIRGTTHHS